MRGPSLHDLPVACGACSACCRREAIWLVKGDDPKDYPELVAIPADELEAMRKLHADFLPWRIPMSKGGACVYLEDGRCSIWDKRPLICRKFSCVKFNERLRREMPRAEIRRMLRDKQIDKAVWQAGVARGG